MDFFENFLLRNVLKIKYISVFHTFVCEIVQTHRANRFFRVLINKNPLCFDVGANNGLFSKRLLYCGGNVIALEPVPSLCKTIQDTLGNIYRERIVVLQMGVGDQEKKEIFYTDGSTMSTFSNEFIEDRKSFGYADIWNKSIEVDVTTLDKLIMQYGIPSYIKIDVEGYELNVLNGLSTSVKCISLEHIPTMLEKTKKCILRLSEISDKYRFNYVPGESMRFRLSKWVDCQEMLALLSQENIELNKVVHSDIYAMVL